MKCAQLDDSVRVWAAIATAAKSKNQMERRLLLNVVVRERAAVFELLAGENQTLLVRRNLEDNKGS